MTITLVQSKTGSAAATSVTVTLTSNTTAGNCLVVASGVLSTAGGRTVSTMTLGGSAGNFARAASVIDTGNSADTEIWTDQNCAGGQTSVVVTASGAPTEIFAAVYEFSGLVTSLAVDKTSTGSTASASVSSGATATTTNPNEVWLGCAAFDTSAGVITGPSSPWINTAALGVTGAGGIAGYQIVSSTGTATYTATFNKSVLASAAVITLKGAVVSVFPSIFNSQQAVKTAAYF